jgi:hypothetical protein
LARAKKEYTGRRPSTVYTITPKGREYEMTGGPFPERLPVISLAYRYFYEQAQALQRWAEWAESATRSWTGVTPETGADLAPDAFTPDS